MNGDRPGPAPEPQRAARGGDDPLLATPVEALVGQLLSLWRWIGRLRWWLLAGALAGGTLAAGLTATLLRQQTAKALIHLKPDQLENPLGPFNRKSIGFFHAPTSTFLAEQLVQGTIEEVVGRIATPREVFETRNSLKIVDYGNEVYSASCSHRDGTLAVEILRRHIANYARSEVERNLAALRREVARLEGTMQTVSSRMQVAEQRLRDFRAAHAEARPELTKDYIVNLQKLDGQLCELEAKLTDIEIELENAYRQLAGEQATTPVSTTVSASGLLERAGRLDRLRTELATLRGAGLRDQHPEILRLLSEERALVNLDASAPPVLAETSVEHRPNERHLQLSQSVDRLQVTREQLLLRIAAVQGQRERASALVEAQPSLEQRDAELRRGQEADNKTYDTIAQVLEMARLQLRLEEEAAATRVEIIDPPALEFSSPALRLSLMTVAGMVVGVCLVAAAWAVLHLRQMAWSGSLCRGAVR